MIDLSSFTQGMKLIGLICSCWWMIGLVMHLFYKKFNNLHYVLISRIQSFLLSQQNGNYISTKVSCRSLWDLKNEISSLHFNDFTLVKVISL